MEYLGLLTDKTVIFTIANTLYVVSYLLTNMLWLRILAVVAAASTFPYFYLQEEPLWAPLFWQSAFLLVNLVNLVILLVSMRPATLSPIDHELNSTIFSGLKPQEMLPILRIAERREMVAGDTLLRHGQLNDSLFLILEGTCEVRQRGKSMARVRKFEFLGEMTFLDRGEISGDVVVTEKTILYVWSRGRLDSLFRKQALYKSYLYHLCGVDLTAKLRRMNQNTADEEDAVLA